jgi:hypothetical protein
LEKEELVEVRTEEENMYEIDYYNHHGCVAHVLTETVAENGYRSGYGTDP